MRSARIAIVLTLLVASCGGAAASRPSTTVHSGPLAVSANFVSALDALGIDVWGRLRPTHAGNVAISPASIGVALAMTYGGGTGETATAMAHTLHLDAPPDAAMADAGRLVTYWNEPTNDYELAIANRLFGERTYAFRDAYLGATRDAFGAELERLDFVHHADEARGHVNGWVSDRTHARIPEILPEGSVDEATRLVLVNAIYFHGAWAHRFDSALTAPSAFRVDATTSVSVPTMHANGDRLGHGEGVSLLELPYRGGDLAMLFVLPDAPDGLPAVEDALDPARIAAWVSGLSESDVEIAIPRFRIETGPLSLAGPLAELGMGIAFSDVAEFDGIRMPSADPLAISDVFHRVFVEVNEEGTEAAAATAVVMTVETSQPPSFIADHPFLFLLRDVRTGAILFMGRVTDPR